MTQFNRRQLLLGVAGLSALAASACSSPSRMRTVPTSDKPIARQVVQSPHTPPIMSVREIVDRLGHRKPREFGERVPGVNSHLSVPGNSVALTFDACGGPGGCGVDHSIIDTLERENVPATLFLNRRWVAANPDVTRRLIKHPLFDIGNHGTRHVPLTVVARSAYGIVGTHSLAEAIDEVRSNHLYLEDQFGVSPRCFRAGTAHYDDVAAEMVGMLGEQIVGFSVNGDAGATFSAPQIVRSCRRLEPQGISIMHMNHPTHSTARGLSEVIPQLRARGLTFTTVASGLRN